VTPTTDIPAWVNLRKRKLNSEGGSSLVMPPAIPTGSERALAGSDIVNQTRWIGRVLGLLVDFLNGVTCETAQRVACANCEDFEI
jgi:hypothetical protein